ncbi:hypothetical protein QFC24_006753 [Naganishia onofrii]|uniref:Uncharacterized protein n=1 Tax=Naganishia onofrii TaxID=1851511 RepID=A0ACC2WZE9_9TREE|nr:hypothetical protein QFC24_006753 [Naganishia onofrii]
MERVIDSCWNLGLPDDSMMTPTIEEITNVPSSFYEFGKGGTGQSIVQDLTPSYWGPREGADGDDRIDGGTSTPVLSEIERATEGTVETDEQGLEISNGTSCRISDANLPRTENDMVASCMPNTAFIVAAKIAAASLVDNVDHNLSEASEASYVPLRTSILDLRNLPDFTRILQGENDYSINYSYGSDVRGIPEDNVLPSKIGMRRYFDQIGTWYTFVDLIYGALEDKAVINFELRVSDRRLIWGFLGFRRANGDFYQYNKRGMEFSL